MGNDIDTGVGIIIGSGYGKTDALYTEKQPFGIIGVQGQMSLNPRTSIYEKVEVQVAKEYVHGRYECGATFGAENDTDVTLGVFASNDFKSPEVLPYKDGQKGNSQLSKGLLKVGVTAGVEKTILSGKNGNVGIFAQADIATFGYSYSGECVYPYESRITAVNGVPVERKLKEGYNYKPSIADNFGFTGKAGVKAELGNLTVSGSGGYDNIQKSPTFECSVTYNFNLFKKRKK